MKRTIKQIAGSDNRIYALADDGTLWEMNHAGMWTQHDGLPDRTEQPVERPAPLEPYSPAERWRLKLC